MIDNLDFVILRYLISYLEANIDRCCFSLTCKRLFFSRDKYLHFNVDSLYFNRTYQHHLNKYRFCRSILSSFREQAVQSLLQYSDDIKLVEIKQIDEDNRLDKTIPYQIESDVLKISYDSILTPICLPYNLRVLEFGYDFNQQIQRNILPSTLKELRFGREYNQPILEKVLPEGLVRLVFGMNFNQPLEKNTLPESLESIEFGIEFQQPLPLGVLPISNLRKLVFRGKFNQPLTDLSIPNAVTTIIFSRCFDQELVGSLLPPSLTSLTLGERYSHPFDQDSSFPPSLTKLYLQHNLIDGSLPDSITTLELFNPVQNNYSISVAERLTLPRRLEHLKLGVDSTSLGALYRQLPPTLQTLETYYQYSYFPTDIPLPNIKTIHISADRNHQLVPGQLPNTLESLKYTVTYRDANQTPNTVGYPNHKLNWSHLPSSIKKLYVNNYFLALNNIPCNMDLIAKNFYTIRRLDKNYMFVLKDNLQGGIARATKFVKDSKTAVKEISVIDEFL